MTYKNNLQTGIDAMDFIKPIPDDIWEKIDTVVIDPPYYESSGKNTWSNKEGGYIDYSKMVLPLDKRMIIIDYIKSKVESNTSFIKFHTDLRELDLDNKILVWYKNDRTSEDMIGNTEFIEFTTHNKIYWKTKTYSGPSLNGRLCSKPVGLFEFLFKSIGSTFVLDPFAGIGSSIGACNKLNIPIYACDIDNTLDYNVYEMSKYF